MKSNFVLSLTDSPPTDNSDELINCWIYTLQYPVLHQTYGTIQCSAAQRSTAQHSTVGVVGRNRRRCVVGGGLSGSKQTRCGWRAMIGLLPEATVQSNFQRQVAALRFGVGCWSVGPRSDYQVLVE